MAAAQSGRFVSTRVLRTLCALFAAYAIAVSVGTLAGWTFKIDRLTHWTVAGISQKPNNAVAAILAGTALFLARRHPRQVLVRVLSTLSGSIAALTLLEHIARINLGIDTLLFDEPAGALATDAPGRMGPLACVCFVLLSACLWLLGGTARLRKFAHILAVITIAMIGIPVIGYFFGANFLYTVPKLTGIAFQTTTILGALAAATLLLIPEQGLVAMLQQGDAGGMLMRRMILPIVLLPLLLGWLSVLGQKIGLYDTPFGTAAFAFLMIVLLVALLVDATFRVSRSSLQLTRAVEESRRARETAESANQAKDRFLAMLSHELRTPLTPALLSVSLLEQESNLPEQMREDLATIRRCVELEAHLIDDLLDLTRIANGKLQLNMEVVDVHDVLRSTLELCCRDANLATRLQLDARVHLVKGDSSRLHQVFWNLINNARKFTPAGGTISLATRNSPDCIAVEVSDTGIGIQPEALPKLFNAFQQGSAETARKFGGLGLGLAISNSIIQLHGGRISACSDGEGRGATFTVELPTVSTPAVQSHSAAPAGSSCQFKPLRILLVEDHSPTLKAMCKLLERSGHRVTPADCVQTALRASQSDHFDILISDLALPDGTGHDIMRSMGTNGMKGIALSGLGMGDDIRKSHEAGFVEHLTKPVDAQTLEAAIKRLVATEPLP